MSIFVDIARQALSEDAQLSDAGGSLFMSGASFSPIYKAVLDYAVANGMTLPSLASQKIGNKLMIDLLVASANNLSAFKKLHYFATDIPFDLSAPSNLGFDGINYANPAASTASRVNTVTKHINKGYASDSTTSTINVTFLASLLSDISKFGVVAIYSDTVQTPSYPPSQISKVAFGNGYLNFFDRSKKAIERYLLTSTGSTLFAPASAVFDTIGIALEFTGGTGTPARAKLHNTAWSNFTNNYSNSVANFTATLLNYDTVFSPTSFKISAYAIYDTSLVNGSDALDALFKAVQNARNL